MTPADDRMTAEEFRAALEIVGETPASFAELLVSLGDGGAHKRRSVERWASGAQDVPRPIRALLQLLVLMIDNAEIGPVQVRAWLEQAVTEDADAIDVAP